MPINSGSFDPKPAIIYRLVTDSTSREPIQTTEEFCRVYIRWPWQARTGSEQIVQGQTKSVGQILCRMRRTTKTMAIDPSMQMVHDGQTYGIISINPIPSTERDEIEFLVQWLKPATLVSA